MLLTIVNSGRTAEKAVLKYQPLAPAYLAAYTPSHWTIRLVDENFDLFDPATCRSDLVAFSALPRHIGRAYSHAKVLRERGIATIGGGMHVSAIPDEAKRHFDCVVEGEAEPVWGDVLADFEHAGMRDHYVSDFDHTLDGLLPPNRHFIHPRYRVATLSTSRGCENSCAFCHMGSFKKKSYRLIPIDTILKDFQNVRQKMVVLSDENFLGLPKQNLPERKELCKQIIRLGVNKYWAAQTTVNLAEHPDLIDLMYQAGCRMVFVGFEGLGESSLREIRKHGNFETDYTDVVHTIQSRGIAVAASFILGLDSQSLNYDETLIQWLDKAKPLFLNLGVIAPMPNTPYYKAMEDRGRLIYSRQELWDRLDKMTTTVRYSNFDSGHLVKMFNNVVRSFFRPSRMASTFLSQVFVYRNLHLSLLYLLGALRKRSDLMGIAPADTPGAR